MSKCKKRKKELCKLPDCIWVEKKREYCRTKHNKKILSNTKTKKNKNQYIGWKSNLKYILDYNGGVYAIQHLNKIEIISLKDNKIVEFGNNIGSGTYNSIYNIKNGNVISMSRYNPKIFSRMEWINNFIHSSLIHILLSRETGYKCVPNIDNFFFTLHDKTNSVSLSKITQKLDMDGSKYFSKQRTEEEWLNYLVQLADKLKYLQQLYKFNHRDLKPDNTMLQELPNVSIINYHSTNYNFNLTNMGIQWLYIDFGFSCLTTPDGIKYKSNEYFNEYELCFRPDRDLSQLFFYCLSFVRYIPPKIKSFLIYSLSNVNYRNTTTSYLPDKYVENKQQEWFGIYDAFNCPTFSNINGMPDKVLENLSKLIKINI